MRILFYDWRITGKIIRTAISPTYAQLMAYNGEFLRC